MRPFDETNLKLLRILQNDARLSVAELARQLRRSEATIRDRIDFLQSKGIIRNYYADVDFEKVGVGASIVVRASIDMREVPRLKAELAKLPHVVAASVLSGQRPIRIRLAGRSMSELQEVVTKRLTPLGLQDIDIRVVLNTIVPQRPADLALLDETKNGA